MSNWMTAALLLAALTAAGVASWYYRPRHDAFLRGRRPDFEWWKRRYADRELPVVISALQAICDAFSLDESDIHRLQPSDRLRAIYRDAYPHGGADSMEFEHLFLALGRRFGVPETALDQLTDPAVSDIIEVCLCHAAKAAPDPSAERTH
jgi:hypothetical protein